MSARRKMVVRPQRSDALASGPGWTLHCGLWQAVLADVTCDALICDPPYGARTHDSKPTRSDDYERAGDGYDPRGLVPTYSAWSSTEIGEFVTSWHPRTRGWIVALTSHDLIPAWESAFEAVGRYYFQPLPCVLRGMSVRLVGDGPSSWAVYAMVARPRTAEFLKWGTLDGAYPGVPGRESGGGRGKPAWLMNALVRDYSKPGDVVCDPLCGWGATLTAALSLGRTAIGSEVDADAYTESVRRLTRPLQIDLLAQGESA